MSCKPDLCVAVGPRLIEPAGVKNVKVEIGSDEELVCDVTGVPTPNVTWSKRVR